MDKSDIGLLLVLRYVVLFLVIASIIFLGNFSTAMLPFLITYLLLYIINNQVRIFFLKEKKHVILVSLFVEIIIISLLYYSFGGFVFIYYFIAVLDASLMLPKALAYPAMVILYITIILESINMPLDLKYQSSPIVNVIYNTLIVFAFSSLGRYIEEENMRKKDAQGLYDRLRVSEDSLKAAYEKLELYSETLEELTILRERNRISREIHDSVGHTLSTIIIQLQALPYVFTNDYDKGKAMVDGVVEFTKNGLENVRRTVKELKPTDFDNLQGIFALKEMASNFEKMTGVKIRLILSREKWILNSDQSFTIYRIAQEVLSNSLRHGKAASVDISLQFFHDELCLYIKDNGIGASEINKGFGLKGVEDRVKSLGGNMDIHTETGKGFEIGITIPRVENLIKENHDIGE